MRRHDSILGQQSITQGLVNPATFIKAQVLVVTTLKLFYRIKVEEPLLSLPSKFTTLLLERN